MDWIQLLALSITGVAILMLLTVGISAQTSTEVIDFSDPNVREAQLRAHRERVSNLLEQRRLEREQEAQRPTGGQDMSEGEDAAARARERGSSGVAASERLGARGAAELHSLPFNVLCEMGERFLTAVTLVNTSASEIDHVSLNLSFDPLVIRPLQVSDVDLRPLIAGEPLLEADLRTGTIHFEAEFQRPFSGAVLDLLIFEWEALVPTPRTRIQLVSRSGEPCVLTRAGRDMLGAPGDPSDGVIGTEIAVNHHHSDDLRGALFIDDPESLRTVQGVTPHGGVELALVSDTRQPQIGEPFAVDVVFTNPLETPIDDLRFALRYDPSVLEVLDAAPSESRQTGDNWIVGGVNLHDAPFRRDFPFDFHLRNEADNLIGLADYRMGLSEPRPLNDGTVARIYLRAIAPIDRTALTFVHGDDMRFPVTSVRCLGIDVLGDLGVPDDGTHDLSLRVAPEPVTTASESAHEPTGG
ncbi:hypothetical protein JXA47_06095 [Candidatus Sumerlaeota bacterium]|nr:hypothetical protein [Candidatus Sumerlaeota bacterium]